MGSHDSRVMKCLRRLDPAHLFARHDTAGKITLRLDNCVGNSKDRNSALRIGEPLQPVLQQMKDNLRAKRYT